MRTLKSSIVVLTLAAAFASASNAQILSPRAEANKTRVVSGRTEDVTRKSALGSPRAIANATIIAPKAADEVDTLAVIRNSRLSPRAQSQAGSAQFEVAVLGGKDAKNCDSACCKK